ncbi:hypothetical protein AYI69_g9781, partial [Smittium culicis]
MAIWDSLRAHQKR